uniref:Kinesin family member 18A n=1 Tax=Astyanax mexicanus TaxID=7994 RepID=A0A8B9KPD7_ASTMX
MSEGQVCSHVKVVVRVRPLNSKEVDGNLSKVVQVVDSHMLVFDPKVEEVTFFRGQKVGNRDVRKRANKDLKFVFDRVFGEDSSQVEVFENTTKGVVDGVLNGYNCTVFAYGATGAGKTHTMLGSSDNPGVMYLTMKELFSRMDQIKEEKVFEVAFSYLEVYNEQIRDLLANSGPLAVREDGAKGVVVQGLTLHQPKSAEHILEALDFGNRNRTQHPTDMNATSSRSHAVFQVNQHLHKFQIPDTTALLFQKHTLFTYMAFRQLYLKNPQSDIPSKKTHIPYRDSKLTRLLKDSLGGNCRTVMIANVSPSSLSYEDTHNTLKYANRAKEIKSTLKSNVVSLDSHIGQYAVICEKQKAEIILLKQKLKEYEERKVEPPALNPISSQRRAEFEKMSSSLHSVFTARQLVRQEQLDIEKQLKENQLRLSHREEWHQQGLLFFPENKAEKVTASPSRSPHTSYNHRVNEHQAPEELKKELRCSRLQLQVSDLEQQIQHMSYLISLQDQENKHAQKLLHALLPAYHRQYLALKAAGVSTALDEAVQEELVHLVQRERGVVWADQENTEVKEEPDRCTKNTCLQPILSFSHLITHQSTPCSAEKHTRRVSQRLKRSHSPKGNSEPLVKKTIRRKLAVSPPKPSSDRPGPALSHCPPALQEVLRQEGMFPLQYTPETDASKTCSSFDPNSTFEVGRDDPEQNQEQEQTPANATVILSPGSPEPAGASGLSQLQVLRANNSNEVPKRFEIPSLLDLRKSKPSYMAMTSAAQGKRKLNCFGKETSVDSVPTAAAPKRVKRDSSDTIKPLRVRRFGGSSENEPSRRVVRSISEGNLHMLGPRKPKTALLGPAALFRKVTKRM